MSNNKLIIFHNADKTWHEEIDPKNYANLPHPFRLVCSAVPNCGKTSIIKNLIYHQAPDFDRIIVWHIDPDSKEYNDIDCEMVSDLPMIEDIDPNIKNLLVIEDIDTKSLDKNTKSRLNRYFGYCSTHKNLSVILTAQEAFQVPVDLRRTCNYLLLWRGVDNSSMNTLGRRFGLTSQTLNMLFNNFCPDIHDSLLIDNAGGPKIRKNLYEIIKD